MGCALDLHINKNGGRTSSVSDMEKIRKNFFCEYMNAPYDKKDGGQTYNFGWKKNYVGLEPKKFNNGDEGATSWVHVDIREFETTYKASHFYIKSKSDLAKKSISDFAKDIGLKDLCLCNGK